MSRYDAYGEFDDKLLDVYDTSFMGFNNRLKADSLNSGILVNSSNFRFDLEGIAQVRKGITLTKAPLVLDDDNALTLDFYIYGNLDSTSVTRTGTTQLTFTRSSGWQIDSDELVGITVPAGITGFVEGNYKGTLSVDELDFVVDYNAFKNGDLDKIAQNIVDGWVGSDSHRRAISKDWYDSTTVSVIVIYNEKEGYFKLASAWHEKDSIWGSIN